MKIHKLAQSVCKAVKENSFAIFFKRWFVLMSRTPGLIASNFEWGT